MSDVDLVSMPYEDLDLPSMGLSVLAAIGRQEELAVRVRYPRFWFAEAVGTNRYRAVGSVISGFNLLGEWTFAGAAFPGWQPDYLGFFRRRIERAPHLFDSARSHLCRFLGEAVDPLEAFEAVRDQATRFVPEAARRIVADRPRIVGCTSTYQQQCASLALLREIKLLSPGTVTLLGGSNCEGSMGKATCEAFPWVDYVVSGDAETIFGPLCRAALRHGAEVPLAELPAGVFRRSPRQARTAAEGRAEGNRDLDLDSIPMPDFTDYFEAVESYSEKSEVLPFLHIETSRGCWWGTCTFCGMNGRRLKYRSKSPERALAELRAQSERYSLRRYSVTDNIIDMHYFRSFLPALAEERHRPVSLIYEIPSLLSEKHLQILSRAGIRSVQPGIESLHDGALELMDKGSSAARNVALLRSAYENGLLVSWNLLYGFPGESDEWYREMAEWLPLIFHLQPPDALKPLRYVRFSRYHSHPEEYGLELRPGEAFSYVYPLPTEILEEFANYFEDANDPEQECLNTAGRRALHRRVKEWKSRFESRADGPPDLLVEHLPKSSVIRDHRPCAAAGRTELEGVPHLVLQALARPATRAALHKRLHRETGQKLATRQIDDAVRRLSRRNLVLDLGGRLVSLAIRQPYRRFPTVGELRTGAPLPEMAALEAARMAKEVLEGAGRAAADSGAG